jgi:hypothetical protein
MSRVAFPTSMSCVLIARVGGAVKTDECEPDPVRSFFKAHTTFEMKPLLYAQNKLST